METECEAVAPVNADVAIAQQASVAPAGAAPTGEEMEAAVPTEAAAPTVEAMEAAAPATGEEMEALQHQQEQWHRHEKRSRQQQHQ